MAGFFVVSLWIGISLSPNSFFTWPYLKGLHAVVKLSTKTKNQSLSHLNLKKQERDEYKRTFGRQ